MDRRKSLSQLSQPDTLVRDRSLAHASGYEKGTQLILQRWIEILVIFLSRLDALESALPGPWQDANACGLPRR